MSGINFWYRYRISVIEYRTQIFGIGVRRVHVEKSELTVPDSVSVRFEHPVSNLISGIDSNPVSLPVSDCFGYGIARAHSWRYPIRYRFDLSIEYPVLNSISGIDSNPVSVPVTDSLFACVVVSAGVSVCRFRFGFGVSTVLHFLP